MANNSITAATADHLYDDPEPFDFGLYRTGVHIWHDPELGAVRMTLTGPGVSLVLTPQTAVIMAEGLLDVLEHHLEPGDLS